MSLDLATLLSALALAVSVFGFARTLPARLLARVRELESEVEGAVVRTRKFEDEAAARAAAQARFLDEAEDLLETNERARRRAAARESREARQRPPEEEAISEDGAEVSDEWDPRHLALRRKAGL